MRYASFRHVVLSGNLVACRRGDRNLGGGVGHHRNNGAIVHRWHGGSPDRRYVEHRYAVRNRSPWETLSGPGDVVFSADGTLVSLDSEDVSLGVWEPTGPSTVALMFSGLIPVEELGIAGARITIRATLEVAPDGQSFSGDYTAELSGSEAMPTGEYGPDSVTGTRVVVEPMGTPVGPIEELLAQLRGGHRRSPKWWRARRWRRPPRWRHHRQPPPSWRVHPCRYTGDRCQEGSSRLLRRSSKRAARSVWWWSRAWSRWRSRTGRNSAPVAK